MLPKLKTERMKKEQLIAQLEGVKVLSTQVDIDKVIALIQQLESEKKGGLTRDLAEDIANRIELNRADVNVSDIMDHVTACLDEFVKEEDEETDGFIKAQIEAAQAASEE